MQFEEEGPKEYADISRVPDEEMRPDRPVPPGCGQDGRLRRCPPRPYRGTVILPEGGSNGHETALTQGDSAGSRQPLRRCYHVGRDIQSLPSTS